MSYILDALKKLENEKTIRNRGTGMLSIYGELFKDERRTLPPGGAVWKMAVVIVAASLVTFGATWFFLKADKARDGAKPNFKTELSPARTVTPQVMPVPPQQTVSIATPQAPLVASLAPVFVHQSVRPVVKATVSSAVRHRGKRQNMPKKRMNSATQQVKPIVPTIPSPSDIRVSGIAWQDEQSARRAVVNGFLMQEGGSVSGAKIAEIFRDRVRFSQAGSIFDVYLLASGFPGKAK